MKLTHTPGPWKAVDAFVENNPNRWLVARGGWGGPNIADCGPGAEADARLIAAAPELLAAIEDLLFTAEALRDDCESHDGICGDPESFKIARAAIAKATGSN